jgi:hypothetical protein
MTAELGLLNKSNVILAADSAVTIGAHNKVFNTANKLFPLSNFEPVGIMIYNNSEWMGIPLEIIIKSYTKQLNDTSFSTLEEYRNDFIKFIKLNFKKFFNDEQIKEIIEFRLYSVLGDITDFLEEDLNEEINELQSKKEDFNLLELKEKVFFELIDKLSNYKDDILPEFSDYTLDQFKLEYKKVIEKILPGFFASINIKKNQKLTQRIYKCLYHELVCVFSDDEDFSGLVVAGYGFDEIFPSISEIKLGEIISNKLRYQVADTQSINNNLTALICPFAQRDMVDTFVKGINPVFFESLEDILFENIKQTIEEIKKEIPDIDKVLITQKLLKIIPKTLKSLEKKSYDTHTKLIVKSISYLRKEDLIEFAESLINLTSIKRKTSSELQSVGGPIDIAVITKHEGFIWIKRKENIDRKYNSAYFNREFKKLQ